MFERLRARRIRRALLLPIAAALASLTVIVWPARGDDGYDLPFARQVRAATDDYRLLLWAQSDGYVRSTDYVPNVGTMYTNHGRFNPPDLGHPTVLVFDQAGRLVACVYQFLVGASVPDAFAAVPKSAWYDIPRHLHYNVSVGGQTYYVQTEWPTDDQPTEAALRAKKLLPDNGTLDFAFVHPKTRSIIVWAWLPNSDGLFAGANPAML